LRRPSSLLLLSALAAAAFTTAPADPASAAPAFRVIVHPQVKGNEIGRAALTALFLKQATRWGDGRAAAPVDQSVQSPVRRAFSFDVLQQSLVEVQMYWQRRIAAGQVPPPVKASDEEVVAFVASTPGAIGYLSPATAVPETVREIAVVP
jgi:ABC-type phosphate transport system substrate-binding protein